MTMTEALRLFTIASSIFVLIFPFLYIGRPYLQTGGLKELPFEDIAIYLPIYYGLSFTILNYILKNIVTDKRNRFLLAGSLIGFILSLIGHYIYRVPEKIFKMKNPNIVHLYAPIMYAFIFGVIVYYIDENI